MTDLAEWVPASQAFGLFAAKLNINAVAKTVVAWCRHSELRAHARRIVAVVGSKENHFTDEDVRPRDWSQCGDNWRFNWAADAAVGIPDRESPGELHLYGLSFSLADLITLGFMRVETATVSSDGPVTVPPNETLEDWVRRAYADGLPWTVAWENMQEIRAKGKFPNASRTAFRAAYAKFDSKLR